MADKKMEQYPTRPKEVGKWEGFKMFLYNGETSEFLGRTGGSWGKCHWNSSLKKTMEFIGGWILMEYYVMFTRKKTWTLAPHKIVLPQHESTKTSTRRKIIDWGFFFRLFADVFTTYMTYLDDVYNYEIWMISLAVVVGQILSEK